MPTTCLICCEQSEIFLLPPCNHKEMCWKCCVTLIEGSTFSCPYCKGVSESSISVLFVDEEQMSKYTFQEILLRNPFKSTTKSYQLYSNERVANFIEQFTSSFCRLCGEIFKSVNALKKHLNEMHAKQFCDVCLENKKCLISEQSLYSEGQLMNHFKKGDYGHDGQITLYHPYCEFCKIRFYDLDALKMHLRTSSHMKCHICEQNYSRFKYIYYKDYQDAEKHFEKSHFVCKLGGCIERQLDNVYVSLDLLEDHQHRVHIKGNKNGKPVMNILLFQGNQQEEIQWDRIGKDFSKQFQSSQKSVNIKSQQHYDSIIDIRQFYPEQVKNSNHMSLQSIKRKLQQYLYRPDYRSEVINITLVPLFKPLEMSSLPKWEIQKFIRQIFEPRYSQPMIQTFFNQKYDQKFQSDYLSEIKRRMQSLSPISYYFVFPQLIRFFKDTNPMKQRMDKYYAESLRHFKINKFFIFHVLERSSEIFNILQRQIENRVEQLILDDQMNLAIYEKYLKDLNPQIYQQHHEQIFLVQKQKIKNMYHMIDKTKTKELLKLNWLLKLGFSVKSYKIMYEYFFYKTKDDCGEAVKLITIQQLALLYAYANICIQALIDKNVFNANKSNPHALFLTSILNKIRNCIKTKDMTNLKQIQNKSVEIAAKLNSLMIQHNKKGFFINEQEHPSLLNNPLNNTKSQTISVFGVPWLNTTNNHNNIRVNNKKKKNQDKKEQQQDFPGLIKKKTSQIKKEQQQQFPVYNYKMKVASNYLENKKKAENKIKNSQNQSIKVDKYGINNPKNQFSSKQWTQDNQDISKTAKQIIKKNQNQPINETLEQIPKKKNKNTQENKQKTKIEPPKTDVKFVEETMMKKKTKEQLRAEQELQNKKQKGSKKHKKTNDQNEQQQQQQQHQECKIQQPTIKKKKKVRVDLTDSEQQQRKRKQEKAKEKQQKMKVLEQEQRLRQTLKNHQGFDSLLDQSQNNTKNNKGNSIINALIQNSRKEQSNQPEIKIKKGKKGKAVVIEKFDLFKH